VLLKDLIPTSEGSGDSNSKNISAISISIFHFSSEAHNFQFLNFKKQKHHAAQEEKNQKGREEESWKKADSYHL
jgi:hypothetical protein